MIKTNYVHVHSTCLKCGGCFYECEHRVRTIITTTGGSDLITMDLQKQDKGHAKSPKPHQP